jgi:hypothetical protein
MVCRPLASVRLWVRHPYPPYALPNCEPRSTYPLSEWQGILQQHQQEIDTLEAEYDQICRDFNSRIEDFSARLEKLRQAIQNELEEAKPKMRDYPIPKARAADEIGEGLYNSDRGYFDQIGMYKAFQGKAT